jgi:hypothetical protein
VTERPPPVHLETGEHYRVRLATRDLRSRPRMRPGPTIEGVVHAGPPPEHADWVRPRSFLPDEPVYWLLGRDRAGGDVWWTIQPSRIWTAEAL